MSCYSVIFAVHVYSQRDARGVRGARGAVFRDIISDATALLATHSDENLSEGDDCAGRRTIHYYRSLS